MRFTRDADTLVIPPKDTTCDVAPPPIRRGFVVSGNLEENPERRLARTLSTSLLFLDALLTLRPRPAPHSPTLREHVMKRAHETADSNASALSLVDGVYHETTPVDSPGDFFLPGSFPMQRLAHFAYRRRRSVVAFWVVALIAAVVLGNMVGGSYSQSFSLSGAESQRATELLQSRFPARSGDEGQIVFADPAGVTSSATETRMQALFDEVAKVRGVTGVESPLPPPRCDTGPRGGGCVRDGPRSLRAGPEHPTDID